MLRRNIDRSGLSAAKNCKIHGQTILMKSTSRRFSVPTVLCAVLGLSSIHLFAQQPLTPQTDNALTFPEEKHLRNIRQLTFGGQNAEAYFSADDKYLIFQHQGDGVPCDQIYTIPVEYAGRQAGHAKAGEHRQRSHHVQLLLSLG